MENKPVKRSTYIIKLSRDHHAGLLFCWKIRQGRRLSIDSERIRKYVAYFSDEHLTPHFEEEEAILFPPKIKDKLVQRALEEHQEIKRISKEIAGASTKKLDLLLNELADTVDKHIRFEERTLFPHLEKALSEKQLKEISTKLDHAPEKDTYPDEFWVKQKNKDLSKR